RRQSERGRRFPADRGRRQRKVAADLVDARHQNAEAGLLAAQTRRQRIAPDRARQVRLEPPLAERGFARRDRVLKPGVPTGDEIVRQAAMDEVAAARQLAEKPGARARPALLHAALTAELPSR